MKMVVIHSTLLLTMSLSSRAEDSFGPNGSNTDGRSDLGDIWNSTDVYGSDKISGINITEKVVIEEILEPAGDYRYAAFGKPDPFLPPFDLLAGIGQTPVAPSVETPKATDAAGEEIAIVSPLQTDLANLAVIGMWQLDDGTRKALISSNTSQAVTAEVGDPIGYTGRIIEIKPEGVLTRQYSLRMDGSREYEDVLLLFGDREDVLRNQIGTRVVLTPGGTSQVETVGPRINSDDKPAGPVPGASRAERGQSSPTPKEGQNRPPHPEPVDRPQDGATRMPVGAVNQGFSQPNRPSQFGRPQQPQQQQLQQQQQQQQIQQQQIQQQQIQQQQLQKPQTLQPAGQ